MTAEPVCVDFEVVGMPAPQGSKTAVTSAAGRAHVIEAGSAAGRERHHTWRAAVAFEAHRAADRYGITHGLDGPLYVQILFRFPMPTSRPKYQRDHGVWPKWTKPDLDKLARSTLDGLVAGGLIVDDSRVAVLRVEKVEASGASGALIKVKRVIP